MSRVGLGRHGQLDDDAGDPLDGLVNLFDVGIVLAVAFLIAGLSIAGSQSDSSAAESSPSDSATPTQGAPTKIAEPTDAPTLSGNGTAVGQVYRLPDGQLVLVEPGNEP